MSSLRRVAPPHGCDYLLDYFKPGLNRLFTVQTMLLVLVGYWTFSRAQKVSRLQDMKIRLVEEALRFGYPWEALSWFGACELFKYMRLLEWKT